MEKRVKKTKITKRGKGFTINFSKKDGEKLAEHINKGGSIGDILKEEAN